MTTQNEYIPAVSICKFCLQEKKLVDAHIIPLAFFEAIKPSKGKDRSEALVHVTNSEGTFPVKKTVKGPSDPNLVCLDCEQRFGPLDEHAIKVLLKDEGNHIPRHLNGETLAWIVDHKGYDYNQIMLFFISLLWRADKTDLPFFARVKIGPYADIAKEALLKQKSDDIERFSVFLARYNVGLGRSPILDPYSERFDGINIYHFYLGSGYMVYIKVDKRPFPVEFENLKLSPSLFLILSRGKLENSKDLEVMLKIYRDTKQLKLNYKNVK